MENFQEVLERMYALFIRYGMKFILALVVLIAGLIVIKWITRAMIRLMKKSNINDSLIPFFKTLTNILLKVMLVRIPPKYMWRHWATVP